MTAVKSLLPPNATRLERGLEQATARIGAVPVSLRPLWDPQACPLDLLPWLAWAVGVEEWDASWPEAYKREVVATARDIRHKKGTPGAIQRALAALGHPNARLIERQASIRYDGTAKFDGTRSYGGPTQWATFSVILTRPVSVKQAAIIRQRIASVKRTCCHLTGLDFSDASNQYSGAIKYDGTYTYGLV
jgi:phage tail P2-like protein